MKKILSLLALALALTALVAGGAFAQSDPAAAVRADVAKLLADSKAAHDTLIADAQRLEAHAKAAVGGSKASARATIKADMERLRADRKSFHALLKADRAQLKADLKAAREAKAAKGLRALIQSSRATAKQQHAEVKQAIAAARAAVKELRASFKK